MIKGKPAPTLVYIQWEDHCGYSGASWIGPEHIDNKPCLINSVGWIVDESKKYITLAGCYDLQGDAMKRVNTIIKSCITKRKTLRIPR